MQLIELKEFTQQLPTLIQSSKGLWLSYSDKAYVLMSKVPRVDEDYCNEHGIEMIPTDHQGGSIYLGADGIGLAEITPDLLSDKLTSTAKCIVKYLVDLGHNAEYTSNDLLIDGYKFGSFSRIAVPIPGVGVKKYEAIQISITTDTEAITHISTKEMVKIPRGLGDYGVRKEDIMSVILEHLATGYGEILDSSVEL